MKWRVRTLMLTVCLLAAMVPVLQAWAERGDITEFDLPEGSRMRALVTGPDGNLWLVGKCSCRTFAIIRLTPDGEVTTFTAAPGSGVTPLDITLGPDGNLWVAEFEYGKILRVTPEGEFTAYSPRGDDEGPNSIASGPDGNLWFTTGSFGGYVGRITVDGDVTEFPLPAPSSSASIIAGPDGRMWFSLGGQRIGMISMDGMIELLDVPFSPGSMVLGSDGNVWVAASRNSTRLVVRFTPEGEMTEFPLSNYIGKLVAGPDGALWGTSNREEVPLIVRITTEGELVEEFAWRPREWLTSLAAGPDGNIWFTPLGARAGRLEVGFRGGGE